AVLPRAGPDGPQPVLDGLSGDDAYTHAPVVNFVSNNPEPSARLVHANGMVYVCVDGMPLSASGATASYVEIFIDADASGDATPQSGDRGFGVTEDGVFFQSVGNGTAMVSDSLSPGFKAKILRSDSTWSAEMLIPGANLNEWE